MLRVYRLRVGWTQEELADASGVSARTISLLETGKRDKPRLTSARLLAQALRLDTEERAALLGTTTSHTVGRDAVPRQQAHTLPERVGSFLPRDMPDFVGRSRELDRLLGSASAARDQSMAVTTIDGMAGVGKTAFAVHAAHELAGRYPDGQFFVDLRGFTVGHDPVRPSAALAALLYSTGVPTDRIPPTLDERSATWRAALAGRRVLLVVDNAADPHQVHPLLPATVGCHVIVTSRRRLSSVAGAIPVSLDVLGEADAIALFSAVAGYELTSGRRDVVAEIVGLCGHLPMAIRAAAVKLRNRPSWTVEWLVERLRDREQRTAEMSVAGTHGLPAALSMSCRLLDAEQVRLFTVLGLYPGADFDARTAAALADVSPVKAEQLLESLVDHHLLTQPTAGRYVFHDLVRDHAGALAAAWSPDDSAEALARLLRYQVNTASAAVAIVAPTVSTSDSAFTPAGAPVTDLLNRQDAVSWLNTELTNLVASATSAAHAPQTKALAAILRKWIQVTTEVSALYQAQPPH